LGNIMLVKTPTGRREIGLVDYGFARKLEDIPVGEQGAFGTYDIPFFETFTEAKVKGLSFEQAYGQAAKAGIRSGAAHAPQTEVSSALVFDAWDNAEKGARKASWYAKHKESQIRASANGYRSGKRHTGQAGKIIR